MILNESLVYPLSNDPTQQNPTRIQRETSAESRRIKSVLLILFLDSVISFANSCNSSVLHGRKWKEEISNIKHALGEQVQITEMKQSSTDSEDIQLMHGA
jgi:hypothetical protein